MNHVAEETADRAAHAQLEQLEAVDEEEYGNADRYHRCRPQAVETVAAGVHLLGQTAHEAVGESVVGDIHASAVGEELLKKRLVDSLVITCFILYISHSMIEFLRCLLFFHLHFSRRSDRRALRINSKKQHINNQDAAHQYPFCRRNAVSFCFPRKICDFTVPSAMPVIAAMRSMG